jgi:hypothetical protein
VQTSNWCLVAREPGEPLKKRKQMMAKQAGALGDDAAKWNSIDWKEARRQVRRLQVRIAKAVKENRWNKVRSLQYLLTHSFYAKLLAVKRVTSNIEHVGLEALKQLKQWRLKKTEIVQLKLKK